MASLAVEHTERPPSAAPARGSNDLIDARALSAEIEQLAKTHSSGEKELRSVIAQRLAPRSAGKNYGSLSGRAQMVVGKRPMMAAHDQGMSML